MQAQTIVSLWLGQKSPKNLRVRFEDWGNQIKFFTIMGESECGRRLVGRLDTGEPMSFSKISRGWVLFEGMENTAQAV